MDNSPLTREQATALATQHMDISGQSYATPGAAPHPWVVDAILEAAEGTRQRAQHKQIKGYRDLSQAEIDAMNAVKAHAEHTRSLIESLEQKGIHGNRWLAIAKTDLQKGYMSLVRAIARPETF